MSSLRAVSLRLGRSARASWVNAPCWYVKVQLGDKAAPVIGPFRQRSTAERWELKARELVAIFNPTDPNLADYTFSVERRPNGVAEGILTRLKLPEVAR